jgi:hypothetical protein
MAKKKSCCKSQSCKKQCSKKTCGKTLPENKPEETQTSPPTKSNFFLDLIRKTFGYYNG